MYWDGEENIPEAQMDCQINHFGAKKSKLACKSVKIEQYISEGKYPLLCIILTF